MVLKIILSSVRENRAGLPIGKWFYDYAQNNSIFAVEMIDLKEENLPFMDEPNHPSLGQYTKDYTKQWSQKIDEADAYVFVIAEYNYGFPASLKNAIDYLYHEWQFKPVSFVSYGELAGGTRSVQMIKPVLTTLNMMPIFEAVTIPYVSRLIDENNSFKTSPDFENAAKALLDRLFLWAKYLKMLREEVSAK